MKPVPLWSFSVSNADAEVAAVVSAVAVAAVAAAVAAGGALISTLFQVWEDSSRLKEKSLIFSS